MKKITILTAVAFVFMLASCDKGKDCKCTSTQQWDIEEMEEPMVTEVTGHIESGECSDGDGTATMGDGMGHTYTQVTKCVEI